MRINGIVVGFGQYNDFPDAKTYTEISILPFLNAGENCVEIDVYFSGNRFSSHYDGTPGVWAEITIDGGEVVCATSPEWSAAPDTRYAFGERTILFVSRDYTYSFDAAAILPPTSPAILAAERAAPTPRPTPPCPDLGFVQATLVAHAADFLLYDLGEERTGLLLFSLEAAGGEEIEILHGEYLKDGRLQDFDTADNPANPRRMVDSYRCRAGAQTFTHYLRRYGCRFIELRSAALASVRVESLGLRVTEHPHLTPPTFRCSDPLFEKMHEISCRTLRCCLHEKYENCPWREQSICEYDARNQMLFGYPLWGNYEHAAAMIRLFARSETPHGFLTAITPSASKTLIPMFTFPWIVAIYEYTFFSGDFSLFDELAPQIERILKRVMAHRAGELFTIPTLDDYWVWNYCEPNELEFCDNPPNAFYNLYLREALLAAEKLFAKRGNEQLAREYNAAAEKLRAACENYFWDENFGAYANSVNLGGKRENFFGHIQALFLAQGIVPSERVPRLIETLRTGKVNLPELPALPYLVRGIFECGSDADREWMHETIRKIYGGQISAGATTWWEAHNGKNYGGGNGSLCHGWSAVPAWYAARYVLGFVPTDYGCKTYDIRPFPLGKISAAEGEIQTPNGKIKIAWHLENGVSVRSVTGA